MIWLGIRNFDDVIIDLLIMSHTLITVEIEDCRIRNSETAAQETYHPCNMIGAELLIKIVLHVGVLSMLIMNQ